QELGNNYPAAYMAKAADLGLTKGINLGAEASIDRGTAARLTYQTLMTEKKTSSSKLMEDLDWGYVDECVILECKAKNELYSNEIITTAGTYKCAFDASEYEGMSAELILDDDDKVISVMETGKSYKNCVVNNVMGDKIEYRSGGKSEVIKFTSSSVIYFDNALTGYSAVKERLETGSTMTLCYDGGEFEYAVIYENDLLGPEIYMCDVPFDITADTRIIRDGKDNTLGSIKEYDVLYYDENSDILYSYCDKASGIYEDAYPSKAYPSSVKVSGTVYEIESLYAQSLLNESSGSFRYDEYITLLLGRDGRVAGVVGENAEKPVYGILLSCDKRTDDGTSYYYATFLTSEDKTTEYKTDKDYGKYRGRVFKLEFSGGILVPVLQNENKKISGTVGSDSIAGYKLAEDCLIVDLLYNPKDETYPDAKAESVRLADISRSSLTSSDIKFVAVDGEKKLEFLVLNNVTMKGSRFGIVTKAEKLSSSCNYTLMLDGAESSYNMSGVAQPDEGDPVKAVIENNRLVSVTELVKVRTSGSLEAISERTVKIGGTEYRMADGADVYIRKSSDDFNLIDVDNIDTSQIKSAEIYSEISVSSGGQIRIVVLSLK
ncbi:MAG: hypothetical protein ACI4SS_01725, partial [Clostridia bacterium]